jgi:hypothetical protein
MKKLLGIMVLGLLLSGNAYAETILLKCKFIDAKQDVYLANVIVKTVKPTHLEKEIEIRLNTALEKIIEAPAYSSVYLKWDVWADDYIGWKSDVTITMELDVVDTYNLDRVTGILSHDKKSLTRIVEDGHYQKDANGNWIRDTNRHTTSTYQCKKEDRLF